MTTPGLTVEETNASPITGAGTDTSTTFIVAEFQRGPLTPVKVTTLDELDLSHGPWQSYSFGHDAIEVALRHRPGDVYAVRALSSDADTSTISLEGKLTVTASSAGDWGDDLQVQVIAGVASGSRVLVILNADDVELERSPEFTDQLTAAAWGSADGAAKFVRVTPGLTPGLPAVAAAASLSGGDDSRGTMDNADWAAAVGRIGVDLGPGQVIVPGITTSAVHVAVADTLIDTNRDAVLDLPRGATISQLAAAVAAVRESEGIRRCAFVGQQAQARTRRGVRLVPYSAVLAGQIGAYDRTGRLGDPVANIYGRSPAGVVVGLDREFSDAERGTLNDAGVSVARTVRGIVTTYSDRSGAAASPGEVDYAFSSARITMGLRARSAAALEDYVLRKVDGRGVLLGDAHGAQAGVCKEFYDADALYGATNDDAYDVGVAFDAQSKELTADIEFTPAPSTQTVRLRLARRAATT